MSKGITFYGNYGLRPEHAGSLNDRWGLIRLGRDEFEFEDGGARLRYYRRSVSLILMPERKSRYGLTRAAFGPPY